MIITITGLVSWFAATSTLVIAHQDISKTQKRYKAFIAKNK